MDSCFLELAIGRVFHLTWVLAEPHRQAEKAACTRKEESLGVPQAPGEAGGQACCKLRILCD